MIKRKPRNTSRIFGWNFELLNGNENHPVLNTEKRIETLTKTLLIEIVILN
jgi:hypothetical protein